VAYYQSFYGSAPMMIDYSTGNTSQWSLGGGGNGINDGATNPGSSGRLTYRATYTPTNGDPVIPGPGPTGVGMGDLVLNPPLPSPPNTQPGADRAEGWRYINELQWDNNVLWFGMALRLPRDSVNWNTDWSFDATNAHYHVAISQPWGGSFAAGHNTISLKPPGYQGVTQTALYLFASGGLWTPGVGNEHRLSPDPALGTGWNIPMDPATAASTGAQRTFQLAGPNTMFGNVPLSLTEWNYIKVRVSKMAATTAEGAYDAWRKIRGDGNDFTKTLSTAAIFKTQPYYPAGGYPAHGSWSLVASGGGYVYDLPQPIHYMHGAMGWADSEADIDALFDLSDIGGVLTPITTAAGSRATLKVNV